MENDFELTQQLPPEIKKVWLLSDLISLVVVLVIIGVSFLLVRTFDTDRPYFFIGWLVVSLILFVWRGSRILLINYRYKFHRYNIDTDDIAIQTGYFFRKSTYVPINRIQHVETEQGPLLRSADLMEIEIHTAATTHKIGGLKVADAKQLRDNIIALVKVAKEDV